MRTKISDTQLKTELFKLFGSGKTAKQNNYVQLRTKFRLARARFLKIHDASHAEWAALQNKVQDKVIIKAAQDGLRNGLKSKQEYLLERQLRIEYLKTIKAGIFVKSETGKPLAIGGQIIVATYADELRALREIHEIEKGLALWQGWDAPAKVAQTDTQGNDVKQSFIINGKEIEF